MHDERSKIEGWAMRCGCHTYITLYYDGSPVRCYDNDYHDDNVVKDEYYTERIIDKIERRTKMKITDIPIIGRIEDFDGMRFLKGGFKKGSEWLNKAQERY